MPYRIEFAPEAEDHLRALTARQRAIVVDQVRALLAQEPAIETRNRKLMRANPLAPWELRIGNLRVYYDVPPERGLLVLIQAVGIKEGNRVRIGKQVMEP